MNTLAMTAMFACLVLTSACGEGRKVFIPAIDAGGDSTVADASNDAATDVCGGCSGSTPVCDTVSMTCVACLLNSDCSSPTPVCDTSDNTCVECLPASEATDCGMKSCDPATNECTDTDRGSVSTCGACVSDTECGSLDRCVSTTFMTSPNGSYCLTKKAGSCSRPYSTTFSAVSLSGEPMADYCAFDQTATSCDAIRGLVNATSCSTTQMDAECNADGALCRTVGSVADQCTYACGSALDCPAVGSGSSCGNGMSSSANYCGG